MLFNVVLDYVMEKVNLIKKGIRWQLMSTLEDLDYADDLCILTHNFSDMQEKLNRLVICADEVGLKINIGKTKVMRTGTRGQNTITIQHQDVEDVE